MSEALDKFITQADRGKRELACEIAGRIAAKLIQNRWTDDATAIACEAAVDILTQLGLFVPE